jgi:4-amino-4-deoxy-L-arabinose transferase-like glycosyltransferase
LLSSELGIHNPTRVSVARNHQPRGASFATVVTSVFLAALAVRLLHIWQIREAPFFSVLMGDAQAYDAWAQRLAGGDWLGHEIFYQAPLYPYLLGVIYALAGRDLLIVRVCQALIGSASCMLLALTARRLFSPQAALTAGLLMALYAPAIFFDSLLQKSVLDVFFVCLSLWLMSRSEEIAEIAKTAEKVGEKNCSRRSQGSPRFLLYLALGVTMGARACARPSALQAAAGDGGRVRVWTGSGAVAGCGSQPYRRRRFLSDDVAIRPQLLHRQQPAG